MPVSGCRRLKPSSGILITPPTWRTDLGDHREHLEYIMGERAGHWNAVRPTYGTPVTSHLTVGVGKCSYCLQENGWHGREFGRGVGYAPPAKVRANSPP